MARLRKAKLDVHLEPEASLVEQFVLLEGERKFQVLRENLDRFGKFGNGLKVIDELCREAKVLGCPSVVAGLYELGTQLRELFLDQFNDYPGGITYPQSEILRALLSSMISEGDIEKFNAQIAQHIMDLDGHFFLILGETMRIVRSKENPMLVEALFRLGGQVARARLKAELPCAFADLYTPLEQ